VTAAARSRFAVIFFTVLIDLIGFGIVIPILPVYALKFGAQGIGYGALVFVFSAMQFLATALLGRLSDRIGRRPILLTTMVINAVGYVLFAFAPSYPALFVARVISGFASGNISAAQAYMADITTPAERSRGMGVVGAAFGIGFSLGPAIGGFALAYSAGTIFILAPAGAGVREAVLGLALSGFGATAAMLTHDEIVVVVLLSRVMLAVLDFAQAGAAIVLARHGAQRAAP